MQPQHLPEYQPVSGSSHLNWNASLWVYRLWFSQIVDQHVTIKKPISGGNTLVPSCMEYNVKVKLSTSPDRQRKRLGKNSLFFLFLYWRQSLFPLSYVQYKRCFLIWAHGEHLMHVSHQTWTTGSVFHVYTVNKANTTTRCMLIVCPSQFLCRLFLLSR